MGKIKSCIAAVLISTMIATCLPTDAFASTGNKEVKVNKPSVENVTKKEAKILKELEDKREVNIKRFIKDDMTYEAVVYPKPVHYLDNGKWKDIDNSLTEKKLINNETVIENKNNHFKVKFSKNATAKNLVQISKDEFKISWGMDGIQNSICEVEPKDINKVNSQIEKMVSNKTDKDKSLSNKTKEEKSKTKEILVENEKKKAILNDSSEVKYLNILPGVDLKYSLLGDSLKEDLIINKKIENSEFKFLLQTKKLIPKLEADNSISFYSDKECKKSEFQMQAPFMYDAKNNSSIDIKMMLENSKEGFILTIKPNAEWLNSKERSFPITLDPPIHSNNGGANFYSVPRSRYSSNLTLSDRDSTYVNFNLPKLNSSQVVTKADFNAICSNSTANTGCINLQKVISPWSTDTISSSNLPQTETRIQDYINNMYIQYNPYMLSGENYYWDMTSTVKSWYSTGNNYGMKISLSDDSSSVGQTPYSNIGQTTYGNNSYGGITSPIKSPIVNPFNNNTNVRLVEPYLIISYVDHSGLKDYLSYHTQDIGRAGTAHISDFNGNLILLHNDVSTSGNRMPINVRHIYSTSEVNNLETGYGQGWSLNLNETVRLVTVNSQSWYEYTDENRVKHNLKRADLKYYKDEDGELFQLIQNADGTIKIINENNMIIPQKACNYFHS